MGNAGKEGAQNPPGHIKSARQRSAEGWGDATSSVELMADIGRYRADSYRLHPGTEENHTSALPLLRRAAELGSQSAKESIWLSEYSSAADQSMFLRNWLALGLNPGEFSSAHCVKVGIAIETHNPGSQPEVNGALTWYRKAHRLTSLDGKACFRIGLGIGSKDKSLSMGWLLRGIELGSEDCLVLWLFFGVRDALVDVDDALARTRRFFGTTVSSEAKDENRRGIERGLAKLAETHSSGEAANPVLAAKLFEISAWLGNTTSQRRLSKIYEAGEGVERNAAVAREWLERSVAGAR